MTQAVPAGPPQTGTFQGSEPPPDPDSGGAGAPGVPPAVDDDGGQEDYFAFGAQADEQFFFPDGKTWVSFHKLNEGEKRRYEARTQGAFEMDRRSGNAKIKVDPGLQRLELILAAVTNWNLVSGGRPVPFSKQNLEHWVNIADPGIVADLAAAIEKVNTWMRSEVTSADIREEISRLEEQLQEVTARERGEGNSSAR